MEKGENEGMQKEISNVRKYRKTTEKKEMNVTCNKKKERRFMKCEN